MNPFAHKSSDKKSKKAKLPLAPLELNTITNVRPVFPPVTTNKLNTMLGLTEKETKQTAKVTVVEADGTVSVEDGVLVPVALPSIMDRLSLLEGQVGTLQGQVGTLEGRVKSLEDTLHGRVDTRVKNLNKLQKEGSALAKRVPDEGLQGQLTTNFQKQKTQIESLEKDVFFSGQLE